MPSPFTDFLARHLDQINAYLAACFEGKATSADIEAYLYGPLGAFSAIARSSACSPPPRWAARSRAR